MLPYRGFVVWDVSIFVLMGAFLLFVAIGWPGPPNDCLNFDPATQTLFLKDGVYDQCYCEQYSLADILAHAGGVRQPINTWFNLYSLVTSFIVALYVYLDRAAKSTQNVIRSDSLIADVYIFAVLFLGLGSMWFHASLTESLSWMDGFSMYTFVAFLIFYTVRRLWDADWFFWVFYPVTVAAFTLAGQFWSYKHASLVLISSLVAVYLALEVTIWIKTKTLMLGSKRTKWLWSLAAASIIVATVFWIFSQTGMPLCDPGGKVQPHGLLWHPLAGVTAVLLYFYWREEKNPVH